MSSFGMLLSDLLGVLFGAEPGETLTLESVVDLEERKHGKLSPPFNTPPPTHPHPHKQNVRG
jgi:hypothetical protein